MTEKDSWNRKSEEQDISTFVRTGHFYFGLTYTKKDFTFDLYIGRILLKCILTKEEKL